MEALLVEYEGRQITIAEASELSGIPYGTIYGRIQRGTPLFKKKNEYKAGDHHYRLTLLEPVYPDALSKEWVMRCDCGILTKARAYDAMKGRIKSCGCLREEKKRETKGKPKEDLTGKVFKHPESSLTVLYQDKACETGDDGCFWICKCSCGNLTSVPTSRLNYGLTKSCGCLRKKYMSAEFLDLIRPIAKKKYLDYQMQMEEV